MQRSFLHRYIDKVCDSSLHSWTERNQQMFRPVSLKLLPAHRKCDSSLHSSNGCRLHHVYIYIDARGLPPHLLYWNIVDAAASNLACVLIDQGMAMDRDRQQPQHIIQLAPPSRGSPAVNTPPPSRKPNDGASRLVHMCPPLYLAAYRGRTEEVMALLLQQHGAATAENYQSTGNLAFIASI